MTDEMEEIGYYNYLQNNKILVDLNNHVDEIEDPGETAELYFFWLKINKLLKENPERFYASKFIGHFKAKWLMELISSKKIFAKKYFDQIESNFKKTTKTIRY